MWIEFHVDDTTAQAWFDYAGYKIRDARLPLTRVAFEVIRPGIEEQFASEGMRTDPMGWRPLNGIYEYYKLLQWGPKPILEASGTGKRRLLAFTAFKIHKTSLIYNPDDPGYMHWHQTGGYKPGKPPQRQIVTITVQDRVQIEAIFMEWLDTLRRSNRARPNDIGFSGPMPGWSVMQ